MINYDLTKIKAVIFDVDGVLSAQTVPMDHEGEPLRTVNIHDGYAMQLAMKSGLRMVILSGARTEAIRKRYAYLGLEDIFLSCSVKVKTYEMFKAQYGLGDKEIAYMGDDVPDIEIMKRVGLACCPADACADVKAVSHYVSKQRGGEGCARDVIEQIMRAQGTWMADDKAFGW